MADDSDLSTWSDERIQSALAAQTGKPTWTLDDDPGPEQLQSRLTDFYRTQEAAGVGPKVAVERAQQYFPGIDHEPFARSYPRLTQERKLQEAKQVDPGLLGKARIWFGGGQQLPFGSLLRLRDARNYDAARSRFDAGNPEESDYKTIAEFEMLARARKEIQEDKGLNLLAAGGEVPGMIGEFYAGGPLARGAGAVLGGAARAVAPGAVAAAARVTPAAVSRAAGWLGETVAMTALAPSTYLDRVAEENRQAGRPIMDVRGLSHGYALGLVQMGVLRGVQAATARLLPPGVAASAEAGAIPGTARLSRYLGEVATPEAMRQIVTGAGGGVVGSAVADTLASSVGLDTGYGTVGQLLGIGQEARPKDALYHATVQALTFAAFTAAHYRPRPTPPGTKPTEAEKPPEPIIPKVVETLKEQARAGATPEEAAVAVAEVLPRTSSGREFQGGLGDVFQGYGGQRPRSFREAQEARRRGDEGRAASLLEQMLGGELRPPEAPPEPTPQPPSAKPLTSTTSKVPPEPPPAGETPRQRVDRLTARHRELDATFESAKVAEDKAAKFAATGRGAAEAKAARANRLAAGRELKASQAELDAARKELFLDESSVAPRPEIVNPVAPNEALQGLRTGAVEVPIETPAEPPRLVTPEQQAEWQRKAAQATTPEAVDALAEEIASSVGKARAEPRTIPNAASEAIDDAVAKGSVKPRDAEMLRAALEGREVRTPPGTKKITAEGARLRAIVALRGIAPEHRELFGESSRTAQNVLDYWAAREGKAKGGKVEYRPSEKVPERAVEDIPPEELANEEQATIEAMRDVIRDLKGTPVPGEGAEAVPTEIAAGRDPNATGGTEAPRQGAGGVEAPTAAGGGAEAGNVIARAQEELADAREAILRGENKTPAGTGASGQGGEQPGEGQAGPARSAGGRQGEGARAGGGVPEPGRGGGVGPEQPGRPGAGRGTGIGGGQEGPPDPAVSKIADEMLRDQIGSPPGVPPQAPPGTPGGPTPPESGFARRKARLVDYLTRVKGDVVNGFAELSGQMFPRLHEAAREAGQALARLVSTRTAAHWLTPDMIDRVGGPGMTPAQDHLWGTTFAEMRLRKIRDHAVRVYQGSAKAAAELKAKVSALTDEQWNTPEGRALKNQEREAREDASEAERAARAVGTLVGKEGSPIASEADFQRAQADPAFRAMLERWKKEMAPFMDEWYRKGAGLEADDHADSPTQMMEEGLPLNLKPARRGGEATPTTVFTRAAEGQAGPGGETAAGTSRGNLEGQKLRKSLFQRQATGAAEGYETSLSKMIQHSIGESLRVGAKAEAVRTGLKGGVAERGAPRSVNALADGSEAREIPKVFGEGGESSLFVRADLYDEYRRAFATDEPVRLPLLKAFNDSLTGVALASATEFAYHSRNLLTMLMKPYMVKNFVSSVQDAWNGDARFRSEHAELAMIGAGARPGHEPGNVLGKYSPTYWMGKYLNAFDRVMRVAAGRAFEEMKRQGLPVDTEAAKRDFVNQLGQYEIRAQNRWIALLRDTGFGPFATAGSNFWAQGLRGLLFSPGVKGATPEAEARLRAMVFGKVVAVAGGTMLANYLLWGNPFGDDETPLGHVKVGESRDLPRTASWDLMGLTGVTRGLRSVGALAYLEAARGIPGPAPRETTLDKATGDALHALIHPATGPGVAFAWTAATGRDVLGRQVAERPEEKGGAHVGHNVMAAFKNANPAIAAALGATHPGKEVPMEEKVSQAAGPFGIKYRYVRGYRRPEAAR